MEEHVQRAEAVRQACIAAALQAYEEAGISGLCHEGRWEYAVDAMRRLPLRPLVQALLRCRPQKLISPANCSFLVTSFDLPGN